MKTKQARAFLKRFVRAVEVFATLDSESKADVLHAFGAEKVCSRKHQMWRCQVTKRLVTFERSAEDVDELGFSTVWVYRDDGLCIGKMRAQDFVKRYVACV